MTEQTLSEAQAIMAARERSMQELGRATEFLTVTMDWEEGDITNTGSFLLPDGSRIYMVRSQGKIAKSMLAEMEEACRKIIYSFKGPKHG